LPTEEEAARQSEDGGGWEQQGDGGRVNGEIAQQREEIVVGDQRSQRNAMFGQGLQREIMAAPDQEDQSRGDDERGEQRKPDKRERPVRGAV
jgi:hypothetical protein